jgi:hypothetical protein
MANQTYAASKRAQSKRDDHKQADRGTSQNRNDDEATTYEQELAHYLQERIKPDLNRGSIPLLARSIAKEIAHRRPHEADVASEPCNEEDEDVQAEADDGFGDEGDGNEGSLEDEMRDLQANLGDDWILRVSMQGEGAWLTAETVDGSQHVEAPTAGVLAEVVELLRAER